MIALMHTILIGAIIIAPIIESKEYKRNIFIILIFLLCHYITNNGKCGLTQLESMLLGKQYKSGFIYRLITPLINVQEWYVDNGIYAIHILLIFILYQQIKLIAV